VESQETLEQPRALLGMTIDRLRELCRSLGVPAYRGDQLATWLYKKGATSISEMTNLPLALRNELSQGATVGRFEPSSVTASSDGTRKYLYGSPPVEAAYIPETDRATLCLSTQVGCSMGCLFCMTARQGFRGNLDSGSIVNQYLSLPERDAVTNIVYMGMGEPLDNVEAVLDSLRIFTADWGLGMSKKRITVSTIGVLPGLKRFLAESDVHLAISLHSPFDEERKRLMPIQHIYPIREVLDHIRASELPRHRRVSFEYIVFRGLNHSARHVKEIARLLDGIPSRMNLIRFHAIPGAPLQTADWDQMLGFQNALKAKGIPTTIRASRGEDVSAACGMLSTKRLMTAAAEDY
jgi:23S rRNA (adenine2503-C2)-methyltransferase